MSKNTININFILDLSCPWCYIGKRRLEKSMAMRPSFSFKIQLFPFYLNSDMPTDGMNRMVYLRRKFGDDWRIATMLANLSELAKHDNINFNFDDINTQPNIVMAFTMIKWAEKLDNNGFFAMDMAERIMRAFFCQATNISDNSNCQQILNEFTRNNRLEQTDIFRIYSQFLPILTMQEQFTRMRKIEGVPLFNINDMGLITGASEPNSFLPIFDIVAQA